MSLFVQYLVAIFVILASATLYIKWILQHWKRRNIPYLEPTLPFGNLENPFKEHKSLPFHFQEFYKKFKEMGLKCGGIYQFCTPVLLIIDPISIRQILTKDFQYFQDRGFYNDEGYASNLFTMDGDRWRILRTKFTPTFTSTKMKYMFNLMVDACNLFEKYVGEHATSGKVLDLKDSLGRSTTNIIGTCAFGIECNSFKDSTFHDMLKEAMAGPSAFLRLSFCNAFPKLARFFRIPLLPRKPSRFIADSIDETVTYRSQQGVTRNDFLQLVMEMKNNNVIDMDELRRQCILFFLAGYETTTNAITFLLIELAFNQDIQQKVREEVDEVSSEYNGEMTYEAIMKMKYLDMVLYETLRKYPPIAFLSRKCVKDFKLLYSDIVLEKGTNLIISNYALHYDPEYFPDPDKFDPERFSEDNRDKILPYTYLPFGEGPRYCIGNRFAKLEIKAIAVTFVRKFRFKLHNKIQMPLLLHPTGVFTVAAEDILFDVEEVH